METNFLLKLFINSNVVLLISLFVIYIYFTNTSILKKKGFTDEFIRFKKKEYTKRIIGMMFGIPILELAAGLTTYLIFGELDGSKHLLIIFIIFLILVIPFPLIDSIKTAKKHKELMVKTQSPVAVDFKHKIFHSFFNPYLEIGATVLVLAFYIIFIQYISPLITIHLALIWLMYFLIRRAKNMNKPLIRESYYYTFVILGINHLLVVFHIIYPFFTTNECCANAPMSITALNLTVLLVLKLAYYTSQLPLIKKELHEQ